MFKENGQRRSKKYRQKRTKKRNQVFRLVNELIQK